MDITLHPASQIHGTLEVPGDKSISHRAALFGGIATGTTRISNFLHAADTQSTLRCLQQLGVDVRTTKDADGAELIEVTGSGFNGLKAPDAPLDCGNSGTTIRLLMGILAGRPFETTLAGDESLSKRPMDRMQIPLGQMGAQISGAGERVAPPVTVRGGNLRGFTYDMPVASAQVKTGVLLAGLQAEGKTVVIEPAAARDHTERMLRGFGVEVEQNGNSVGVSRADLQATDVRVPGDISSAAFFWVAAALRRGWQITVQNVGVNPTRTGVLDVLRDMGAEIEIANERISGGEPLADVTVRGAALRATEIGGALIPRLIDELPVLALLATQAEGKTV
ncbi:MAG TPA: 3-phosphoshikimate 1-carboxyvinyltransferase, partial [Abditibacteriaceae bacterium]